MDAEADAEQDSEGVDPDNEYHSAAPKSRRTFAYDWAKGFIAPYHPSPAASIVGLLQALRLTPEDTLADLGCGDGRICLAAARDYGCRAVGFDLDNQLIDTATAAARQTGLDDKVSFTVQDLRALTAADMARMKVTVIVIYLLPETFHSLENFLRDCLTGGSVRSVASVTWPLRAFVGDSHNGFHVYPRDRNTLPGVA